MTTLMTMMPNYLRDSWQFIYFVIGILYAIYNSTVRKLDGRDDSLLVLTWVFAWPVYMVMRLVSPKKHW